MRYETAEQIAPWCALNRIFGFAPKTGLSVIRHFGSPEEVFRAGKKDLEPLLGNAPGYISRISMETLGSEAEEVEHLLEEGIRFVCIDDERYPSLLKECDDPPLLLYMKSASPPEEVFSGKPAVAVVGTRDITSYGKEWCTKIVTAMGSAEVKPMIVSGLAIGTDITAHLAALDAGLPTIAVMATGIDAVYPFRHGWHADRIASSPGSALVTDYPPGTAPKAINFLRRNRIIAGLSEAVILTESRKKGGGLMTCHLASSYNRDVYALPGRIEDVCSEGCNILIGQRTADAIYSVNGLLDSIGLGREFRKDGLSLKNKVYQYYKEKEDSDFAAAASEIAEIVRQNRDICVEDIASLARITFRDASSLTGILECDGIIVTDLLRRCSINPNFM